ncbi:MFS general substrate transporter [Aspergillus saccharolyticus JOP 1030-1]|uniref:MFS general substrate transporter n=1 Tax=Aspergillus saccharolyticus JOP 1030-1 TaxID=1450539 RepID=A0A318ZFI0_9EURO|nr:MFS general substrate transporter [Aspergillus saccharolyticus JOP 1030-1]PYH42370.1 MFS general substrate transporter [Aspergillus saccharolyticus JOP 1030-1]
MNEPPGTVTIEDVGPSQSATVVVLEPTPTDDPNDPLNWPKSRKTVNFVIASFYTLASFVLLDIGTVIWVDQNAELGISWANLNNSFAANLAGLAVGCILLVPFAIKYGRRSVYILSTAVQFATAIWNASLNSTGELLAVNVLSGLAGAVSEALVQMTIVDIFFVHQRASANGMYNLMVNTGAYLAPVAAGYCATAQGWRWIWWWTAIMLGLNLILFIFFFEESKYIPVLLSRPDEDVQTRTAAAAAAMETTKFPKQTSIEEGSLPTSVAPSASYTTKSYRERMAFITKTDNSLLEHIKRPLVVLIGFPAVTFTALVWGCFLSWFSILATTQSTYLAYPPYAYNASQIGLFSLPPFIGGVFGAALGGPVNDWYILWRAKRNNGIFEPETRLHLGIPAILATPLGILLFGLGLAWGWPWWSLALGSGIFGCAFTSIGACSLAYLSDCYQDIVGDALVGVAFVRNGLSTVFVFALTPWIEATGLVNMFIAVACIATGTLLSLIPMIMYGKRMRVWTATRYRAMAQLQPGARRI